MINRGSMILGLGLAVSCGGKPVTTEPALGGDETYEAGQPDQTTLPPSDAEGGADASLLVPDVSAECFSLRPGCACADEGSQICCDRATCLGIEPGSGIFLRCRDQHWTASVGGPCVSTPDTGTLDVASIDEPTVGPDAGPGDADVAPTSCAPERDDSWIAFDSDRAEFNRDIYIIHPDRSGLTRLTTDGAQDKEPAFDPKGGRLSFTSVRSGVPQVFFLDLTSKAVTPLTNHPGGADQSSFSPDGSLVAFHSGASVYVIGTDGQGEKLVATGLDNFNAYFWPHFSASGTELVFDRNNEIDAIGLDGMGLRRIVQNWTTTIKSPAVSPSGTDVAYHVYCDSGLSIWTTPFSVTTDPCKGRRVTPVGEPDSARPAWGSNDRLAYERIDHATNIASIAVISRTSGSLPCVLTPGASDNRNPAWSP
jgi:Tol biopolymer transport system component